MAEQPMSPEELAKVIRDARAWVERTSFRKQSFIDALCLALLAEYGRAERLAAENAELRVDAARWRAIQDLGGIATEELRADARRWLAVRAELVRTGEVRELVDYADCEWPNDVDDDPDWHKAADRWADRLAEKEGT